MIITNLNSRAGIKCSCSRTAIKAIEIDDKLILLCQECVDNLVNGLRETESDKSYNRDKHRANFKVWTHEDEEVLKSGMDAREISKVLGRTLAAVRKRAAKLDIKLNY
ncbi:MAG: hypothetical protein ACRCX2_27110 [Paraclostridium sp.]